MPRLRQHHDLGVRQQPAPRLADGPLAKGRVVRPHHDERGQVARHLVREVCARPCLQVAPEGLLRRVLPRLRHQVLHPRLAVAVAGGGVDDGRAVGVLGRRTLEELPARVVERRRRRAYGTDADDRAHPLRGAGGDAQRGGPAHRVPDEREPLHARGVQPRQDVVGDLAERVLACFAEAFAIPAVVDPGDRAVLAGGPRQQLGEVGAPPLAPAEPTVQRADRVGFALVACGVRHGPDPRAKAQPTHPGRFVIRPRPDP